MAASDAAPPQASSLGTEAAESSRSTTQPIFIESEGLSAEPDSGYTNGYQGGHLPNGDYWAEQNLLSLDGGGIRGYWTLLALQLLMELVGEEERVYINPHTQIEEPADHSFWPLPLPDYVTHGPFSETQDDLLQEANGNRKLECLALKLPQRFLPCHYFDYICGSSTGGLIAIMLGRFRMTVSDCLHEYETMGSQIFGKPRLVSQRNIGVVLWPKYNAKHMKQAFEDVTHRRRELLPRSNRIKDVTFPCDPSLCKTFVTAFYHKRKKGSPGQPSKLYLIRTYNTVSHLPPTARRQGTGYSSIRTNGALNPRSGWEQRNPGPAINFEIWEVARAATAAPMYFKALEFKMPGIRPVTTLYFSDGGFGHTNNPCVEGVTEIQTRHGRHNVGTVVSVGTARGIAEEGQSLFKRFKKFVHTATDPATVEEFIRRLLEANESPPFQYWRINDDQGLVGVDLDDWRPNAFFTKRPGRKTLERIRDAFTRWAVNQENRRYMDECAKELVARRRERIRDIVRWQRYATGAKFECRYAGCNGGSHPIVFQSSQELRDHLRIRHADPSENLDERVESMTEQWRYQPPSRPPAH